MIDVAMRQDKVTDIGRVGENEHRRLVFDISTFKRLYPQAEYCMMMQRPGDPAAYPVPDEHINIDGNYLYWTLRNSDLAAEGIGECELRVTQNNVVAKDIIYMVNILCTLDATEEPPEPWEGWVEEVHSAAEGAIKSANDALETLSLANATLDELRELVNRFGIDIQYDDSSELLYLVNAEGEPLGYGTQIHTGIGSLNMFTTTDDTGTQYLVLEDGDGNELARTEFIVSGGGSTAYTCRLTNGMGTGKLSFPSGQPCTLNFGFTEYYGNEQTTVNAALEVYTKTATTDYELRLSQNISQGNNSVTVTPWLTSGTNYVKIQVTGGESGTVKSLVFTINVVEIALTSSFDSTKAYSSSISFLYRVIGRNLGKTMHFKIDDNPEWTVNIGTVHNTQLTEVINLAAYGHGDHLLRCWFVTDDGAISPSLTYDIMFDAGSSTPIISSVFDTQEINFGDLMTVQYVVYTHGQETTDEVDLDIYTLDDNDEPTYYMQQTLTNVVNEQMQSWNITEYPGSGTVYLRIGAGAAEKVFAVTVRENADGRDLSGITTRLIAAYSPSGRSNNEANRAVMNATYTSKDDVTTVITSALTGFNWRSNGWLSDNHGYPALRVSGGAEVNINLPFFASSWTDSASHTINLAGTPTGVGRTFEVSFSTSGVTDENEAIISIWDEVSGIGVKVFPSKAYLLSSAMSIVTDSTGSITNKNAIPYVPFSSAQKVRLSFVIEEVGHYVETEDNNQNKQLVRVYVDGELSKVVAYTSDDFSTSTAKPKLKAENCVLNVYSMRYYDVALSSSDVLQNYIADLPSISERIEMYDKNDITDDNGEIDLTLARQQYPCMVMTGTLSAYKGDKVKIGVLLYHPDSAEEEHYITVWEFMDKDANDKYGNVNNVQGTSSQYYIKKNYKITFYRWNDAQNKFAKAKVSIMPGMIPVSTICVKADYMSPDSANTGNANFWQSIITEPTPPQVEDNRVQTSVMGYPILMFQHDSENAPVSFIGRYNLNNDKGNSEAFGLENDGDSGNETKCQKWEYKDNSEDICNFLTDELHAIRTDANDNEYEAWEDALESCYPDQGDLEDEGLSPNLDYMQSVYTWLTKRANFLLKSHTSGTGGTYNGVEYDSEYDLRLAIFKREFPLHFNLHHTLHYFIANEVSLLVDNLAKNLFMTTYDTSVETLVDSEGQELHWADMTDDGVVDDSDVDWERSTFAIWYPTLYDLDSCLGADNNGYDQFPYYTEMWDQYNSNYVVNGHNSLLWRLVYAAYWNELRTLYRTFRDTDASLTPANYMKAMITDLTECLPVVSVNEDEKFKYIDAYEGGYYDGSANDGQGGWVYTQGFLYLVKGTMASYHQDFITKRFVMLDSKYTSDAFMQDYMTVRINRPGTSTPAQLAFNVSPCQAMYCYSEWGNSGSLVGGKTLEGASCEMKPTASGTWSDIVVAVYGASHIKSFGDLSVIIPSKFINLARCANLTELIVGSTASGYENAVLDSISDVSYLTMLQKLNISNCTALTGTVDLSNCDIIEEVYASGSAVSSVVLPEGGYLKKLYLPGSITALNVIDHSGLTHFGMDSYASLTRIRVENTPNIDTAAMLAARGNNIQRLRLIGVNWVNPSEDALRALADPSMAGKAIDANGNNVQDATVYPTVTGTVTIDRIQKSLYTTLQSLYPNLTINATTMYHKVTFMNGDAVHAVVDVDNGANATPPNATTKVGTVQYAYSFSGWSGNLNSVTEDRTAYAQYAQNIQQYTMKFCTDNTYGTVIETSTQTAYGSEYTYASSLPTRSGYVFCGWQDADGHTADFISLKPDAFASVDEMGVPVEIKFYPVWSEVTMPTVSKTFDQFTPGERMFAAIAIQNGGTTGVTATYYSDTGTYTLYKSETGVSVSISIGDTKQWTLYNGETLTQRVIDFNHDYSDLAETHKLGITYDMRNCLKDARRMVNGYKYCANYRFGNHTPYVLDNGDYHQFNNDPMLINTYTVDSDDVTAGYVDLVMEGRTYLTSIKVTHSDQTTATWELDYKGFYCGTDSATFPTNGSGTATGNDWYVSDLNGDPDNPKYKIGKILQSLGCDIQDRSRNIGLYGWATAAVMYSMLTNQQVTLNDFGGLKIDTTGTDSLNTAVNNQVDGTGKSRIVFFSNYQVGNSRLGNYTELSEGTVLSIPVVSGDTITVTAYGASRNCCGWAKSELRAWANEEFFEEQLPYGLRNTIVGACKKATVGNGSFATEKVIDKMWCLSYWEQGFNVSNAYYTHQYPYEGAKYPVYTNASSIQKRFRDGAGDLTRWWSRSPSAFSINYYVHPSRSGAQDGSSADSQIGVSFGFCSGEAVSSGGGE